MKPHIVLITALLILNILDYDTTVRILGAGGTEANPIMNYVIVATGVMWPILAIKMGFVSLILLGYELVAEVTAYLHFILVSVVALYTGVVARSINFCIEFGLF